jgi:hypothetical protein
MKPFLIFIAFLVLASGVAFTRLQSKIIIREENQDSVLSQNSEETSVGEDPEEKSESAVKDTPSYIQDSGNFPTPTQSLSDFYLEDFIYPGSEVVSSGSDSLSLKITDDPDKITDWYKEKIISGNMNVKTFVTTKTNNDVLNRLVGAKSGLEIGVEIKKDDIKSFSEVLVTIKVF